MDFAKKLEENGFNDKLLKIEYHPDKNGDKQTFDEFMQFIKCIKTNYPTWKQLARCANDIYLMFNGTFDITERLCNEKLTIADVLNAVNEEFTRFENIVNETKCEFPKITLARYSVDLFHQWLCNDMNLKDIQSQIADYVISIKSNLLEGKQLEIYEIVIRRDSTKNMFDKNYDWQTELICNANISSKLILLQENISTFLLTPDYESYNLRKDLFKKCKIPFPKNRYIVYCDEFRKPKKRKYVLTKPIMKKVNIELSSKQWYEIELEKFLKTNKIPLITQNLETFKHLTDIADCFHLCHFIWGLPLSEKTKREYVNSTWKMLRRFKSFEKYSCSNKPQRHHDKTSKRDVLVESAFAKCLEFKKCKKTMINNDSKK